MTDIRKEFEAWWATQRVPDICMPVDIAWMAYQAAKASAEQDMQPYLDCLEIGTFVDWDDGGGNWVSGRIAWHDAGSYAVVLDNGVRAAWYPRNRFRRRATAIDQARSNP